MNQSNPSSPASSRAILKLRTGVRKSPKESKTPSLPATRNPGKLKPGAQWSDEYRERMQADMDLLSD
jgi:hypothetical protein